VHVDYYELVDAPDAVMPRVFEAIGLEWTDDVEQRIRTWRSGYLRWGRDTLGFGTYIFRKP